MVMREVVMWNESVAIWQCLPVVLYLKESSSTVFGSIILMVVL